MVVDSATLTFFEKYYNNYKDTLYQTFDIPSKTLSHGILKSEYRLLAKQNAAELASRWIAGYMLANETVAEKFKSLSEPAEKLELAKQFLMNKLIMFKFIEVLCKKLPKVSITNTIVLYQTTDYIEISFSTPKKTSYKLTLTYVQDYDIWTNGKIKSAKLCENGVMAPVATMSTQAHGLDLKQAMLWVVAEVNRVL